jgi:hypothetical protein
MTNFKSGSGNLDFGGDDDDDNESESPVGTSQTQESRNANSASTDAEGSTTASSDDESSEPTDVGNQTASDASAGDTDTASASFDEYPYFVRRNNVGDERDKRLEIHVRDRVADQEAQFRSELADHLDTSEVSKTDAREFALLAAFEYPEQVAELMREEGFGKL